MAGCGAGGTVAAIARGDCRRLLQLRLLPGLPPSVPSSSSPSPPCSMMSSVRRSPAESLTCAVDLECLAE